MLSDPGDAACRCPLSPRAMLPSGRMKPSAIPKKYFNGAQSLQPPAYGLHPLCLRLAPPVTSKSPRRDTECGGSALLLAHVPAGVVRGLVARQPLKLLL